MRGSTRIILPIVAVLSALAAACSTSSGPSGSGAPGSGGSDPKSSEVASTPVSWPTFGFDQANSRFNRSERTISTANAATLAKAWEVPDLKGVASTPTVVDGVVYFGAWDNKVHAVDAATGAERWATAMPDAVVAGVMSSVTVTDDAAYAVVAGTLVKLARSDGRQLWTAKVSDHPLAIAPGSPIVVGDLVLQGVASGELMVPVTDYKFRGVLSAFDVSTGAPRWTVAFTPDDPSQGGAGVGIWSTPSIDRARKLAFIGTGNTYEPPAAKLSDSIVAIRYETGEIAWSRQFTYPDVWSTGNKGGVDGDVGAGPNLWEAGGHSFVGAGDKRGVYHALDRDTGAVVWETPMTPGSLLGGVIGTSAVGEGRIYVGSNVGDPASNGPTGKAEVLALDATDGHRLWAVDLDGAIYSPVTTTPGLVYVGSTNASMYVLDATTGSEVWTFEAPDQVGGGASVVNGTLYWGYGFSLFGTGSGKGGLIAFRPGGTAVGSETGPTAVAAASDAPGADIFRKSCSACHGPTGRGGTGPSLVGVADRLTLEAHIATVTNGRNGQMPSFGGSLSAEEIRRVVEYERTQL